MKKLTNIFIILSLLIFQGCGGKVRQFDIAQYEINPGKITGIYIEPKITADLYSSTFNRVAIIEFNVEYLVNMPDSVYMNTTEDLYKIFVESIETNTEWHVINKKEIINNEIFKGWRKKNFSRNIIGELKNKNQGGIFSTIYPAEGLGILPTMMIVKQNLLSFSGQSTSDEAVLLESIAAAATLKVHTIIGYTRKKNKGYVQIIPTIKGIPTTSKVDIYIGYMKKSSLDGKGYDYYYKNRSSFELKRPIISYESVTGKTGTFDLEEFVYWTREMFGIYAEMLAITVSENF